jgi:hypothetical protein
MFRNFFSAGEAVLDVQPDGILDVLHRLFVAVALAVAALQRRTGYKVSVRVGFDNNRQAQSLHAMDYNLTPEECRKYLTVTTSHPSRDRDTLRTHAGITSFVAWCPTFALLLG